MMLIIVRLSLYSRYFFGVSTMVTIFQNASNYTLLLVPVTVNETRVISLSAPPTLRDARLLVSFFQNASQFFTTTTILSDTTQTGYDIYPFIALWCLILTGLVLCIMAVHMKQRLSSMVTKTSTLQRVQCLKVTDDHNGETTDTEDIGRDAKYDTLHKFKTWVSQQTMLSYEKIKHGLCRCTISTMSRPCMVSMIPPHELYLNTSSSYHLFSSHCTSLSIRIITRYLPIFRSSLDNQK